MIMCVSTKCASPGKAKELNTDLVEWVVPFEAVDSLSAALIFAGLVQFGAPHPRWQNVDAMVFLSKIFRVNGSGFYHGFGSQTWQARAAYVPVESFLL